MEIMIKNNSILRKGMGIWERRAERERWRMRRIYIILMVRN
jgi:hypothetical protein